MNMKKNISQTGNNAEYTPNWISIDDFLPGDDAQMSRGDDDLYPEIDPLDRESMGI
ncbi:hypothetical protein H7170_04295 [Candidatus Gracilibacteria bacterium]|nr:hypothetical protein [Candidatus Gracilibacteria bacterium]